MPNSVMRAIFWYALAASVSANSAPENVKRSAEVAAATSTWLPVYTTTWLPASTVTVNPLDVTSWISFGTRYEYPFTTTSVLTSGCVSYSYIGPDADTTAPVATTVQPPQTYTVTARSTATETRTDRPVTTVYSPTQVAITQTTGRTDYSTYCTNTLVASMYVPTIYTSTYTVAAAYTRVTATQVCMTDITKWWTIPGVTLTSQPYIDNRDRFTAGTIVTSPQPMYSKVVVTVTVETATTTDVICNNPSVNEVSTYFTVTRTPSTTTIYQQRTDCAGVGIDAPAATVTAPPAIRNREFGTQAADSDRVEVRADEQILSVRRGPDSRRVVNNAVEARQQPVETRTISFTTGVIINSIVTTLTATAEVDVYTVTFTTVEMVGATVIVTATETSSVCSLPTLT